MRKPHTIALNLPYDNTLIVDNANTDFWDSCGNLAVFFPGEDPLRMVVFPCTFALGYGSTVPGTFDTLVTGFDSRNPNVSITAGKTTPGVAVALRTLALNDFCTFFGKDNKCGTAFGKFSKMFKDNNKPNFCSTMLIKEGFCPRNSPSGLKHTSNYNLTLMAALMYTKQVNFAKYSEVLKEHTKAHQSEPRPRPTRDEDSDSDKPLSNRTKATVTTGHSRQLSIIFSWANTPPPPRMISLCGNPRKTCTKCWEQLSPSPVAFSILSKPPFASNRTMNCPPCL